MEKIIEKRTILGVLLFVLFVGCLIEYNVCPNDTLHDYKYVAYYLDGGQVTREYDSVSSYRNELDRARWKFQCFYYHNGEYESDIDFVTRYKIYDLRSYPNNTAHRRWHLFLSNYLYTALAAIAAAFLFTFNEGGLIVKTPHQLRLLLNKIHHIHTRYEIREREGLTTD